MTLLHLVAMQKFLFMSLYLTRGALGYTRNRKTEENFIQNRKTANKIGQNRKPHTKQSKPDTMAVKGGIQSKLR